MNSRGKAILSNFLHERSGVVLALDVGSAGAIDEVPDFWNVSVSSLSA